jgi:hypothetical protein
MKNASSTSDVMRIAVFDMDETLGTFSDLSEFIYTLARILKPIHSNPDNVIRDNFNAIVDLYPEVLRPKIMDTIQFLVKMKRVHKCDHVMIYTNNTGPREWTESIKNYFNYKSGISLFDRVIGAFKRPNGETVEVRRTSHDKTYNDLVRCTNLEGKIEVFFVDDRAHPGMHTSNVYVIEVKPYERRIAQSIFIKRFMSSPLYHSLGVATSQTATLKLNRILEKKSHLSLSGAEYTDDEREVDALVGETILEKVKWFFDSERRSPPSPPKMHINTYTTNASDSGTNSKKTMTMMRRGRGGRNQTRQRR